MRKLSIFLFSVTAFIVMACRREVGYNGSENGVFKPEFKHLEAEMIDIKSDDQSVVAEFNSFRFSNSSFVNGFNEIEPNILFDESQFEFRASSRQLSIQDIGFESPVEIKQLIYGGDVDDEVVENSALIFGNNSSILVVRRGNILLFLSDGEVADDFLMVMSLKSGKIVWLNPEKPFSGKGGRFIRWLAPRVDVVGS